jgi:hypothetical protein
MADALRIGLTVAGIATLVFGVAASALWLAQRLIQVARKRLFIDPDREELAERMQAVMTNPKDPVELRQQFKELVAEEGPKELARRAKLWHEAASSVRAARRLQRDIEDELDAIDDIRRYAAKHRPEDNEGMQGLELYRREIEQELVRAETLIRQLRA